MTFFERYSALCEERQIEPCSQRAADMFKTTRATISTWGKNNSTPRGETVALIANGLCVSTDYLLGRTDDPTDYTKMPDAAAKKPAAPQLTVKKDADKKDRDRIVKLYSRLDAVDRVRVESYIEGILTGDKYKQKEEGLA